MLQCARKKVVMDGLLLCALEKLFSREAMLDLKWQSNTSGFIYLFIWVTSLVRSCHCFGVFALYFIIIISQTLTTCSLLHLFLLMKFQCLSFPAGQKILTGNSYQTLLRSTALTFINWLWVESLLYYISNRECKSRHFCLGNF